MAGHRAYNCAYIVMRAHSMREKRAGILKNPRYKARHSAGKVKNAMREL